LIDRDLILSCQAGDVNAFNLLVDKYNDKAIRTAFLITGRKDLAEDIAQETFIQCYYQIRQLKHVEYFTTWFYKILVRTGWKMVSGSRRPEQVDIDREPTITKTCDYDPEKVIENREKYEEIYQAVNSLSRPLKEVVVLHYFNDLTIKEIAAILNCREGTVKSRLYNARKLLAKNLRQGDREKLNKSVINEKECITNARTSTV
jgi:RNA polymerase sigma-70 factor (ECF subfamily)